MTTGRGVRRAGAVTVVALLCCGLLVSCGQEKQQPGTVVADGSVQGQSGAVEGGTDVTTDETTDKTTDETTDESGTAQPDLTTDDGEPVITSEEEMAGWYDAKADFRGHLASNSDRTDDVLGPLAVKVIIRKVGDTNEAQVWMEVAHSSDKDMQRMAGAFAKWRQDVYDDKGHVSVLISAKMGGVEKDW
ncbi:hypothetical protein OH805_02315 [Streptomyces sp. NBC_00879]|uniref:hypothetical protein n=1 Tax=Streptomyces sp. NBC_00879 TaxID=2975855 RepID=UPI00386AE37A|nr:hypothetical protein OH805_02315 [Streptomyces sp. NBC_00879]